MKSSLPKPLAFEFRDESGALFTAHHLLPLGNARWEMICDGIPVAVGWTLYRDGTTYTVESVAGKIITVRGTE